MKSLTQKLIGLAVIIGLLLLVPFVAMQFTDEVAWTVTDFVTAASLLFGTGLAYVLLTLNAPRRRLPVAAALLFVLGLVWAELAVGVFGTLWAGS
ncbi:MAG: hypothetical protein K2X34_05730 [Hyphomonadaceae bacterium]|nr:hypothetical protein [Hyphomonadaceae bacterium]